MREDINTLYHWKIEEVDGGEIWVQGIRINGKKFKTLVFEADLPQMKFTTPQANMKLVNPEVSFFKNVQALYGSMEAYFRTLRNLKCRGRMPDLHLEEKPMARWDSDYEIRSVDHDKKLVKLVDLDLGNKSITNDAERVVRDVNAMYPGYRIVYLDTMKMWSELSHNHGKFVGFLPYDEAA